MGFFPIFRLKIIISQLYPSFLNLYITQKISSSLQKINLMYFPFPVHFIKYRLKFSTSRFNFIALNPFFLLCYEKCEEDGLLASLALILAASCGLQLYITYT